MSTGTYSAARNLTRADIDRAVAFMRVCVANKPILVGMAVPPSMHARIKSEGRVPEKRELLTSLAMTPILVDPRLSSCELFYDLEKWRARCDEQREFDLRK